MQLSDISAVMIDSKARRGHMAEYTAFEVIDQKTKERRECIIVIARDNIHLKKKGDPIWTEGCPLRQYIMQKFHEKGLGTSHIGYGLIWTTTTPGGDASRPHIWVEMRPQPYWSWRAHGIVANLLKRINVFKGKVYGLGSDIDISTLEDTDPRHDPD